MERLYGQKSASAFIKAAAGVPAGSAGATTLHAAAEPLAKANIADILPDVQLPEGELGTTARGILGSKSLANDGNLYSTLPSSLLYS